MKLSVIGLNFSNHKYSSKQKYANALKTFFEISPKVEHEVILVDNGSTDNSVSFFRDHFGEKITIIPLPKNGGFHKGNNAGIRRSTGEYIMLHNPDVAITQGMVEQAIEYMDKHPDIAILGPKLIYESGKVQDSFRKFMHPQDFFIKRLKFLHKYAYFKNRMKNFLMWTADSNMTQEVDWLVGACVFIRKSMMEEVGLFDEKLFLFGGDPDLCKKFWKKGWKVVYFPRIIAHHSEKRLSGHGFIKPLFQKLAWIHFFDLLKYFWKWRGDWDREKAKDVV